MKPNMESTLTKGMRDHVKEWVDDGEFQEILDKDESGMTLYPLGRIANQREQFSSLVNYFFLRQNLEDDVFKRYCQEVSVFLGFNPAQQRVLRRTMQPYVGKEMTKALDAMLSYRLVGGQYEIKAGRELPPLKSNVREVWVPCEIIDIRYSKKAGKTQLFSMTTICHAGPTAGRVSTQQSPYSFFFRFRSDLGWPKFKKGGLSDLFGYQFTGYLDQTSYGIQFTRFKVRHSQMQHNTKLRSGRAGDCPKNLPNQCYECSYGLDQCKNACHMLTYVKRFCPVCRNSDVLHDPDQREDICIRCDYLKSTGRLKHGRRT